MTKYVAPIVSALVVMALVAGYAVFWFLVLEEADVERIVKIGITVVAVLVIAGVGAALASRIRELKGGLEDDVSKY